MRPPNGVHAFVLYHLNATTYEDFGGEFGATVGVSGRVHGEEDDALPIHHMVLGVEGSTGRRLSNVLFDALEARQVAAFLLDAADEIDELHAEAWTPERQRAATARLARRVLPTMTDAQLIPMRSNRAPWLADELRQYLTTVHPFGSKGSAGGKRVPHAPLFPGRINRYEFDWAQPVHAGNLHEHYFAQACCETGLSSVRFHDLRHTFATMNLSAGEHYMQVSK